MNKLTIAILCFLPSFLPSCDARPPHETIPAPDGGNTVTMAPLSCEEEACETHDQDCGLVVADCDGDGVEEFVTCGFCEAPEACMGSDVQGQCGSACMTTPEFAAACQAAELPSTWAFYTRCGFTYRFDENGEATACAGCSVQPECGKLTLPSNEEIYCCP